MNIRFEQLACFRRRDGPKRVARPLVVVHFPPSRRNDTEEQPRWAADTATGAESRDAMKGYAANAQIMADVAAVIEQARREGRDVATALRIARVTLAYVSGPNPDPEQAKTLENFDRHLKTIAT
jgi:hypothetical protein